MFCVKIILRLFITNVFIKDVFCIKLSLNQLKIKDRFLSSMLLVSIRYKNAKLISEYVSKLIYISKNHFRDLKFFTDIFEHFFIKNVIKLLGFQLRVTGKVGGRLRKKKYQFKLGKTQSQTININLSYYKSLSFTRYGIISIKVWLFNYVF